MVWGHAGPRVYERGERADGRTVKRRLPVQVSVLKGRTEQRKEAGRGAADRVLQSEMDWADRWEGFLRQASCPLQAAVGL